MEAIHSAALDGRLGEVNRLLEEDPGLLNARDFYGRTTLIVAAWRGHDAVVARLLQMGADVHARDEGGNTVAHEASMRNQASTLALLLDAGDSINARTDIGGTIVNRLIDSTGAQNRKSVSVAFLIFLWAMIFPSI